MVEGSVDDEVITPPHARRQARKSYHVVGVEYEGRLGAAHVVNLRGHVDDEGRVGHPTQHHEGRAPEEPSEGLWKKRQRCEGERERSGRQV